MAQLGSGQGSRFPQSIDTKQLFANGTPAAPDDATRLDAELANDILAALVNLETTLGANPQGTFGSLAARLQQFAPGGGASPAVFAFTAQQTLTILGTTHRLGTAAMHVRAYDAAVPRVVIQPESVMIDQTTYDVTVTFGQAASGYILLQTGTPQHTTPFTATDTVSIPGATHQLGSDALLVTVFNDAMPWNILQPGAVSINRDTFDVTVTFGAPLSGTVLLSAAGPRFATPFTDETSYVLPGAIHGLTSPWLLVQVYDDQNPTNLIEPATVQVNPGSFDVTLTFEIPTSGTVLLVVATPITGTDFEIRNAGITNQTAVRVYSQDGHLNMQAGAGEHLLMRNKAGDVLVVVQNDAGLVKMGLSVTPAFQLHLVSDSAAKPGSSAWTIFSDARLKHQIRPFTDGLAVVLELASVLYRYNGQGGMRQDQQDHIGFLAQAVQTVAPYMVKTYRGRLTPEADETDLLTVDMDPLFHLLVNAIKEVTARVVTLEEQFLHLQGASPS